MPVRCGDDLIPLYRGGTINSGRSLTIKYVFSPEEKTWSPAQVEEIVNCFLDTGLKCDSIAYGVVWLKHIRTIEKLHACQF